LVVSVVDWTVLRTISDLRVWGSKLPWSWALIQSRANLMVTGINCHHRMKGAMGCELPLFTVPMARLLGSDQGFSMTADSSHPSIVTWLLLTARSSCHWVSCIFTLLHLVLKKSPFLCGTGIWTLARQGLYHFTHTPSTFCFSYFSHFSSGQPKHLSSYL
jgi:hypothetical protein